MKSLLLFLFVCNFILAKASMSIEGYYQGKNLYVQSALCNDGFGYCATKVTVNGKIMPGQIENGAFEINFENFNMKIGQPLFIVIEHNDGCQPKIINPEVLLPNSTFNIEEIKFNQDGFLSWETTNEEGELVFEIEQYKWNKWVVIGEVMGSGKKERSSYAFDVFKHSGVNKIRVSQVGNSGIKRSSKEIVFNNIKVVPPSLKTVNEFKSIIFVSNSQKKYETKYEIYDAFGNIVKKGLSYEVDLSNLKKGIYYVNYDNVNERIIKKK